MRRSKANQRNQHKQPFPPHALKTGTRRPPPRLWLTKLMLFPDRRHGGKNHSVASNHQEITLSDLDRNSILDHEDVCSKAVLPQMADLHPMKVAWFAQNL